MRLLLIVGKIFISMFIDFRNVLYLIDYEILFLKPFHHGFDVLWPFRSWNCIRLPQGSVSGPLFFLIFINYLPYSSWISSTLFADDITIYDSCSNYDDLISKFLAKLEPLLYWVKQNRMTINLSKTKIMFFTKKHIMLLMFVQSRLTFSSVCHKARSLGHYSSSSS